MFWKRFGDVQPMVIWKADHVPSEAHKIEWLERISAIVYIGL